MVVVEKSEIHRNGVLVMIISARGGSVGEMDVIQLILQKDVQHAINSQINVVVEEEVMVVVEEVDLVEEEVVVVEVVVVVVEEVVVVVEVVVVCNRI
jgi:hypothetical protein